MGPQNESTSLYDRGTSFGQKTSSQTFYDCRKITYEKIDEIYGNFPAYLAKYKTEITQR